LGVYFMKKLIVSLSLAIALLGSAVLGAEGEKYRIGITGMS